MGRLDASEGRLLAGQDPGAGHFPGAVLDAAAPGRAADLLRRRHVLAQEPEAAAEIVELLRETLDGAVGHDAGQESEERLLADGPIRGRQALLLAKGAGDAHAQALWGPWSA